MVPIQDFNVLLVLGGFLLLLSIGILVIGPKVFGRAFGILSIVGIFAIIGVGISLPQIVEFFGQPTRTGTLAKSEVIPQQVDFIRLFPTEFTVTWNTQAPVIGAIRYGLTSTDLNLAAAELDPSQTKAVHLVRVTDLSPGTTYYVEIISGGERFDNEGHPYTVTLPTLTN